jgi:predicted RNase H-like HicB family nuclease
MRKDFSYYSSLDYPVTIKKLYDGNYCAEIRLLNGCKGYGKTADDALEELDGVKETIIEMMLEEGKEIPEPQAEISIKLPASLRAELEKEAQKKHLSISEYLVEKLSSS